MTHETAQFSLTVPPQIATQHSSLSPTKTSAASSLAHSPLLSITQSFSPLRMAAVRLFSVPKRHCSSDPWCEGDQSHTIAGSVLSVVCGVWVCGYLSLRRESENYEHAKEKA